MWGPGISAVICYGIFGTRKKMLSLFGSSPFRSLIAWCTPILILFLLTRKIEILPLLFIGYFSILGEELGWRGWLQDHLPMQSDIKKSVVIGFMWEIWHFTNRTTQGNFVQISLRVLIWCLILSILSFLILKLTKKTSSLTIAVVTHGCFDMLFMYDDAWIAVLISLPIWLYLFKNWPATMRSASRE